MNDQQISNQIFKWQPEGEKQSRKPENKLDRRNRYRQPRGRLMEPEKEEIGNRKMSENIDNNNNITFSLANIISNSCKVTFVDVMDSDRQLLCKESELVKGEKPRR